MEIEVSLGEVVDKVSILDIKRDKIKDPNKLENIKREYDYLVTKLSDAGFYQSDKRYIELYNVNVKLWNIEDDIRELERQKRFDSEFIELARKVYMTNDERAKVKLAINLEYNSKFVEEKSYAEY